VGEWQTRRTQNPSNLSGNTSHRQAVTAKTCSIHAVSVRYTSRNTGQCGEWKRKANRYHYRHPIDSENITVITGSHRGYHQECRFSRTGLESERGMSNKDSTEASLQQFWSSMPTMKSPSCKCGAGCPETSPVARVKRPRGRIRTSGLPGGGASRKVHPLS
jgi:hypothetical protein